MSPPVASSVPSSRWLLPTLALLSAVAPLATDMYLPSLPRMARELGSTAAGIQLTLTAFLAGLGCGQFFIGPLSDAIGRRRPLLAGALLCLVASVLCALSDTLELLVAARFLQGFSGAAGVVLARAIVADTSVGNDAARRLSLMMVIGGVAPVLAPTVGGLVAASAGWRAVFWVLAGLVALMCVGVLAVVRETLPPAARHGGGLGTILGNAGKVLRRRCYLGYALTVVFAFAVMFSYIAASPLVLQNVIGLSPTVYGLAFGTNAVALILANVANARLVGRVAPERLLRAGVCGLLLATATLAALLFAPDVPKWPVLVVLWLVMACLGLVYGNGTALALGQVRELAGTGSAFLGTFQFIGGAAVAPLVGLAGEHDPRPMAVAMLGAALLSAAALFVVAARGRDHRQAL